MDLLKKKINNLPQSSGVYIFKNSSEDLLYIGKAKNLKKRVKDHFQAKLGMDVMFIDQVAEIDFIPASSEKKAMLLEAQLIKKHQPKYNIEWKDDKNFFYVAITKENYPRIFLTHQIKKKKAKNSSKQNKDKAIEYLGPFVNGTELKKLKIRPF